MSPLLRSMPPALAATGRRLKALALAPAVALALGTGMPADAAAAPRGETVAQDPGELARLRAVLKRITLPDGFRIDVYALVPGARHMAVAPQGSRVFVGTRGDRVWVVSDRDSDRKAETVRQFAPTTDFIMPNGVCFGPDGVLYVVEQNRVLGFDGAGESPDAADPAARAIVPRGKLIPPAEESRNHSARVCRIGPDDRLYISLGQPYNVPPRRKLALYDKTGIGGIIRINRDGSGREVFTRGIRNSVGHDFHPETGELWFTDNQVDRMGDDIPPGEINRQTAPGQHFGFPWYGGGAVRTREYAADTVPEGMVMPVVETIAHAADLGMRFYTGTMFPERYRGGIFSAQHGSWDRTTPVGARVMFTAIAKDGSAETVPFAEGWLDESGAYLGRPVDVAQLPDGSLLVSDDRAGALYRIWYAGD